MRYALKFYIVDAVMFDPTEKVWPDGVLPWPDSEGFQPRDMSWGYVNRASGRRHVLSGDWIVTGTNSGGFLWRDVMRPDEFVANYEPVEVVEL